MSQTQSDMKNKKVDLKPQTQHNRLLLSMERDLAVCRRAIVRSVVVRNIYRVLFEIVLVLAIAAIAEIVSSTVRLFAGGLHPLLSTSPGSVGVMVLFVGSHILFILAFRRIARERPNVCETAERLDLAVDDHNRIATALWLMKSGQHGPFVEAAIDDGLIHLKLFRSSTPDRTGPQFVLREHRNRLLVTGLLVVVAILFQPGASYFPQTSDGSPAQMARGPHGSLPPEATEVSNPSATPRQPSAKPNNVTAPDQTAATASEAAEKLPGSDKETEGSSGRGKSSSAQSSSNASAANSSSSDSSSETKGRLKKQGKQKKPSKKKPHKETKAQKPQDSNGGSSSVSQGSSGGGSMLAVQHDWAQHAQAAGSETEDEFDDDEEELDDENEENRQRGGIQPTLKDRNESPSRELGIGEGDGPPGSGRGGPTPPKKSRGTASLVLGVPVPDFVRGRLSPGPTKITQERVRPVPMGAEPSGSNDTRVRTMPEPIIPRSTLPAETLPLIREYLIRLHQTE